MWGYNTDIWFMYFHSEIGSVIRYYSDLWAFILMLRFRICIVILILRFRIQSAVAFVTILRYKQQYMLVVTKLWIATPDTTFVVYENMVFK